MTSTEQQIYYDQNPKARWLALLSVCLSLFIVILTMSATNIAIPVIARDLNASAVAVSWIPTAVVWGMIVVLLPVARVADIHGRKKIYVVGIVSFSLVSLFIFLVEDIESLLVLRVLQGFSSAMINGTGMAIVGAIFSNSNRGTALGISSASVYLGLSCGPLVGGLITEYIHWRAIFWMPVSVMLISLSLVFFYLKGEWKNDKPEPLDWIGSALFALWVSLFFIGASGLPELKHGLLMMLGLVLLVVFLKQQARAKHPLIRLKILSQNRMFSRSILSSFLMYSAHFSSAFLLILYLQYIHDLTPLEAGKLVLVQTVIMMVLAPISGRLSDKYEPRIIATIGCLAFTLGFALLFWVNMTSPLTLIFVSLVLQGIGFGFFSSPNNNATIGSADKKTLSIATVLLSLSRTMGNMFGTVVVMVLITVMLGDAEIQPHNYPQLLWVIKITFAFSFFTSLIAAYFSFSRGKIY